MRKLANLIVYQRDIRRVNGNVASYAAHCNADSRFFERGRVIDTVSDHADRASGLLEVINIAQLILREAPGAHGLHADLRCNRIGCRLMVAREQNRLHRKLLEPCKHLLAVRPQRIGQHQSAREPPVMTA